MASRLSERLSKAVLGLWWSPGARKAAVTAVSYGALASAGCEEIKEVLPGAISVFQEEVKTEVPTHYVEGALKIGLACGIAYAGYKVAGLCYRRWRKYEKDERAAYIRETGLAVLKYMEEEARNEVPDFFYVEPVLPEEIMSSEERGLLQHQKHKSVRFLASVTHKVKNYFGGVPNPLEANSMAVTRMVYELCKEHNCLPHQTRHIVSVVVPLVMTPDQFDISSRALLNSPQLAENRAEYGDLVTISGWMANLICHPLDRLAWRRAMDALVGLPDWQAFRLVR